MRVLMLYTRRGCADGFTVREYHAGERYELADGLARYFIRSRWAVECAGDEAVITAGLRPPAHSPFSFQF